MNRIGNLYGKICSIGNLEVADLLARKGKKHQYGVRIHDKNRAANINALHRMLIDKTYKTSAYTTFTVYEPKERVVYRLPYFPDRILHHAIMLVLEKLFVAVFTANTFSCIKGRGIHGAARSVRRALKDEQNTIYCLKFDIQKFYPSIDHDILKILIRRKIKDVDLLWLLDEIIDSAPGLPIGNYLSQYFANFYLTYFDHWIKETKQVKYYFRYTDDIVILSEDKDYLHDLLLDIREYLTTRLKLTIKNNYQVFPVKARSIDFVGYRFYHTHILLRKNIKKNFARKVIKNNNSACIPSYWGWAKHCNSNRLLNKIIKQRKLKTSRRIGNLATI